MRNQINERDFIDLLSSLFYRKRMFYLIFLIFISLGFLINATWNNEYKFTLETKTPTKDTYLAFSEYLNFINGVTITDKSGASGSIAFNENRGIYTDYSDYISRDASFDIITNFKFDLSNFHELSELYIDSLGGKSNYDKFDLSNKIRSSISIKIKDGLNSVFTVSNDDENLVNFLYTKLATFLNERTSMKYYEYAQNVRNSKVEELESMMSTRIRLLENQLISVNQQINLKNQTIELNLNDNSQNDTELNLLLREKLLLTRSLSLKDSPSITINAKSIPGKNVNYFHIVTSQPAESDKVNKWFVYLFLVFASLLFHLMMVILIDLKTQINIRINSLE
jgi:hypothetical protein